MSGFVWSGNSGCLLPFLIIFNLFFGRSIFHSTRLWLGIEAILILIFLLKINILARKIAQQLKPDGRIRTSSGSRQAFNDKIIDVQAEAVNEKEELS